MNIVVVSEADVEQGLKERVHVTAKDIYRVAALWVRDSSGRILLAQRAFTKAHHPGQWGPAVAGTVEEGETYESNIVKEAQEEIGITGVRFREGPKTRTTGRYNHFTQWFMVVLDWKISQFTVDAREVAQVKWWEQKELREEVRKHPELFLRQLPEYLKILK